MRHVCPLRQARVLRMRQGRYLLVVSLSFLPTVTGLILTPSSRWALAASSESLDCRTFFPHSVLTNVVRPAFVSGCLYWAYQAGLTCSTGAADHQREEDSFLDILLLPSHLQRALTVS